MGNVCGCDTVYDAIQIEMSDEDALKLNCKPLQKWVSKYTQENRVPGMLVGVWKDGKEVAYMQSTSPALKELGERTLVGGKTAKSNSTSMPSHLYSKNTMFRIFSMTKPIAAAITMIAIELKKLYLDEEVCHYIPGISEMEVLAKDEDEDGNYTTEPQISPMTIRHLLTHTSGLSYGLFGTTIVDQVSRLSRITRKYHF